MSLSKQFKKLAVSCLILGFDSAGSDENFFLLEAITLNDLNLRRMYSYARVQYSLVQLDARLSL
uniref:Uncharacterized protein n=1 Tax=Magallana gigas TaxID=29159 RepID=K1PK97_MAGGI